MTNCKEVSYGINLMRPTDCCHAGEGESLGDTHQKTTCQKGIIIEIRQEWTYEGQHGVGNDC